MKLAIPAALILMYAVLALQPELRLVVPLLVGITAGISIILAFSRWDRLGAEWGIRTILAVALVTRLFFLFSPPQLSDDIYRYVWDGTRSMAGINPYRSAPASVVPPLRLKEVHFRINHAEFPTIYPPAAQIIFAAGAALRPDVTGLKSVLVSLDLVFCWLLMRLLGRLRLPVSNAVLYAWNPLPILEIAGAGHIDGAGLTMVAAALLLLLQEEIPLPTARTNAGCVEGPYRETQRNAGEHGQSPRVSGLNATYISFPLSFKGQRGDRLRGPLRRVIGAGALAAGAALVKLFPLVLCPALSLLVPRRFRLHFWGAWAASGVVLIAIFLPEAAHALYSLKRYALDWEFAGFAFTSLRALTGSGATARLVVGGTFTVVLGVLLLRQVMRARGASSGFERGHHAVTACCGIAFAFLMLTPTLQPWYALWLAGFLPFCPGAAGLVLCWAVFLTYQVQIPYFILSQWREDRWVTAAVFAAPLVAGVGTAIARYLAREVFGKGRHSDTGGDRTPPGGTGIPPLPPSRCTAPGADESP